MKRLHESLFILHKCYHYTKLAYDAIDEHRQKGPLFSRFHFTQNLVHYVILESTSFLEEYNTRFNRKYVEPEYFERLDIVRTVCKPIIKQIEVWKGLRDFRNNIIAHPWRDNGILVVDQDSKYIIPRTWIEVQFLKDLISYVHDIIKQEFELEFNASLFLGDQKKVEVEPVMTMKMIRQYVQDVFEKSQEQMSLANRDYNVRFIKYFEGAVPDDLKQA